MTRLSSSTWTYMTCTFIEMQYKGGNVIQIEKYSFKKKVNLAPTQHLQKTKRRNVVTREAATGGVL